MIIHAVLLVHFLLPAQIAASQGPAEATKLLQSATDAESRGDFEQAIADVRKAVELTPSSAIVLLKLGDAYMRKRDYEAAIPPLKRALELSPILWPYISCSGMRSFRRAMPWKRFLILRLRMNRAL